MNNRISRFTGTKRLAVLRAEIKPTHYFLFYYNEDISAFQHPNITPIRLNEENTPFFEARGFLQIDINAIPAAEHIGFLTPSIFRKARFRHVEELFAIPVAENTIVGLFHFMNNALWHAKDVHGTTFIHLWNHILTRMNYGTFANRDFRCSFSNLWLTKRGIAIEYIRFIRSVIETIKSTTGRELALLNSNIPYVGRIPSDILQQRIGFPHYTYHAFLCERMIGIFATIKNINYVSG